LSATKQVLKNALIYGIGNGLTKVLGLILLPFYTSVLAPSDYGVLASLTTFITLMITTVNVGLDGASMYYYYQIKEDKEKGTMLFTKFILRLFSTIPALVISFFSRDLSVLLFKTDQYTSLVFISCLLIPAQMLVGEQQQIYRILQTPWKFNLLVAVRTATNIGLGIALVLAMGFGVWGAQMASLVSAFTVFLFSFSFITRKNYTYQFSWHWAKKMTAYGTPLIIGGIAAWTCRWSDRIFLIHFSNLDEIGYYAIGETFSEPLTLINQALQISFMPVFWLLYNKDNDVHKENSKNSTAKIWSFFLSISVIAGVFISVFSVTFIKELTNAAFIKGALAVPFLAFALIAMQSQQLTRIGIFMEKKTKYSSGIAIITALINIGLNFYFIPKYGFVGAAFTTFISYFLGFLMVFIVSNKLFAVPHKIVKNFGFFFLGLFISVLFPYLELVQKIPISLLFKVSVVLFVLVLPFLLGLINIKDLNKQNISFFKK